jgi:hypothetical protein
MTCSSGFLPAACQFGSTRQDFGDHPCALSGIGQLDMIANGDRINQFDILNGDHLVVAERGRIALRVDEMLTQTIRDAARDQASIGLNGISARRFAHDEAVKFMGHAKRFLYSCGRKLMKFRNRTGVSSF